MPTAVSSNDDALNTVRTPEHSSRHIYTPLSQKPADRGRADPLAAYFDLINLIRKKAQLAAHLSQQLDIAAPALAKSEAFAQINLACMQAIVNDLLEENLSRLAGKLAGKSDDDRLFNAEYLKICQPLIEGLQQRRSRFSMKHGPRMRIECDRRRSGPDSLCPLDNRLHYSLVSEVKPVKNAQRQNRRAEDIRVLSTVKNLHTLWTILRPRRKRQKCHLGRMPAKYAKRREKRRNLLPANNANIANEELISISVHSRYSRAKILFASFRVFGGHFS